MKLPKTFRTEKNLDEKIRQLIERAEMAKKNKTISPDDIICMAKEIASEKGKNKEIEGEGRMLEGLYEYICEEKRIRIKYEYSYVMGVPQNTYTKVDIFSYGELVLSSVRNELEEYKEGAYENQIFKLYTQLENENF